MTVGYFMTRKVITISPDTSFHDALKLMKDKKIRRLPVVENDKLVGIVTEKDLLYASPSMATTLDIWELHYLLSKLKVKEIMTKEVITVREDDSIVKAALEMAENKVGALPVLNEAGNLVGIITETDIFKIFIEMMGTRRNGMRYTFETEDRPGLIKDLSKIVYDSGGSIISFVTIPIENGRYMISFKAKNLDTDKFESLVSEMEEMKLVGKYEE
ncbi:MAG: CBS domain-containing protein [Thermotogae bacterium]|nr:CBS domain-containing protein [Thermotogota bacterium]